MTTPKIWRLEGFQYVSQKRDTLGGSVRRGKFEKEKPRPTPTSHRKLLRTGMGANSLQSARCDRCVSGISGRLCVSKSGAKCCNNNGMPSDFWATFTPSRLRFIPGPTESPLSPDMLEGAIRTIIVGGDIDAWLG
jgi:hypothetical protein